MITVFLGGSRRLSRLPEAAQARIDNIVSADLSVVVGDANGADKAIQKYLASVGYRAVEVFCSGDACRNNLGGWPLRTIRSDRKTRDYQYYAAKDREMAARADYGLMLWDGDSVGSVMNVLRLVIEGKTVVLIDVSSSQVVTLKSGDDWTAFIESRGPRLIQGLFERASPRERAFLPETRALVEAQPRLFKEHA